MSQRRAAGQARQRGGGQGAVFRQACRGWGAGSGLQPEVQLLLLCARIELDLGRQEELRRLMAGRLDWEQVMGRAAWHGLSALLARHLEGSGVRDAVPSSVLRELDAAVQAARLLELRQRSECGRLLDEFRQADVEAIALKGLALRETVYPEPGLRPAGDLDLLVRLDAIARAEEVLRQLGYVAGAGQLPSERHRPGEHFHLPPYRLPGRDVQVELHWDLVRPPSGVRSDINGVWRRAVAHSVAGRPSLLLSPEDQMLHLALHAAQVNLLNIGLRHLVDVAELARQGRDTIDWNQLAELTAAWRAKEYAYLTLRVAEDLLGSTGPSPAMSSLRPEGFDEALVATGCQRVLSLSAPQVEEQPVQSTLDFLRLPSAGEKLQWLGRNLFPSHELVSRLYGLPPGSNRVWSCYIARLIHVLGRYARLGLGVMLSRKEALEAAAEIQRQRELDYFLGQNGLG